MLALLIAIKNYVLWKGILSFRFRLSAECLKTKMSLFFHFLLFYSTIDDEKKNSIRKYVVGGKRMKKSLKIMRKQFFAFASETHLCILKDFFPSVVESGCETEKGKSIMPLIPSHITWFSVGESSQEFVSMFKVFPLFWDASAFDVVISLKKLCFCRSSWASQSGKTK